MNLHSDELIDWTWTYRDIGIYFKLDSKNRVYSYKYRAPKNQEVYFASFKELLLDEYLDKLQDHFVERVFQSFNDRSYLFLKSVYQLREALKALGGERIPVRVDYNKLICRCAGQDRNMVKNDFDLFKGDLKAYVRSRSVSMGCGTCRDNLKAYWKYLNDQSHFYDGKTELELISFLEEGLEQFIEFTHLDIGLSQIEIGKIHRNNIIFKVDSSLPHSQIQTNLENFFRGHKQLGMEISIL